jgi:hypothetical protein
VKEERKNEVANLKVDNRDFSAENAVKLFLDDNVSVAE